MSEKTKRVLRNIGDFCCLVIAILVVGAVIGCFIMEDRADQDDTVIYSDESSSFEIIEDSYIESVHYKIVRDTETNVLYYLSNYGTMTVLLSEDGSPLLYNERSDE